MNNSLETTIVMDILIGILIPSENGITEVTKRLKYHLKRAIKTSRFSTATNIEKALKVEFSNEREYANTLITIIAGDDQLTKAYFDIFELWNSLITQDSSKLKKWHKEWIVMPTYAERFKGGKRSIYQGSKNQLNATIAINKTYENFSGIVVTKAMASEYLSDDVEKYCEFQPLCHFSSPIIETGKKNPEGFFSIPVWPIEFFEERLTDHEDTVLEKLRGARKAEFDVTSQFKLVNADLFELIKRKINWHQETHKITLLEHSRKAYYDPINDFIKMPKREQFSSEIDYYSTWVHELSHSTMKILKRTEQYQNKTQKQWYAIEEVIAETCAFLSIKRLYDEAKKLGIMNNQTREVFERCYSNSESYIDSWGKRINSAFFEILKGKHRNHIVAAIIKDVFLCHSTISNGAIFGKPIER